MGTDVKQRLWVAGKGFKQLQGEAKVFGWCRFAIAHIVALHPVDNGQVIVFRDNPVRTQEWKLPPASTKRTFRTRRIAFFAFCSDPGDRPTGADADINLVRKASFDAHVFNLRNGA